MLGGNARPRNRFQDHSFHVSVSLTALYSALLLTRDRVCKSALLVAGGQRIVQACTLWEVGRVPKSSPLPPHNVPDLVVPLDYQRGKDESRAVLGSDLGRLDATQPMIRHLPIHELPSLPDDSTTRHFPTTMTARSVPNNYRSPTADVPLFNGHQIELRHLLLPYEPLP